ncbi:MAG: mannose-1-phosphate guanylyltransferase/mannose-6-phosphate isomerase [Caulobacterales bacterium 68-7]|nr:MAG: mannose-1-phosphate guanylyltransferase/mannose-6-phosphate isomerase [Caulobacterales bacterium 68-7]
MAIYPVILCGGSGTRLWPASRPDRPKQFLKLTGDRSSFQETLLRLDAAAEVKDAIIVTGAGMLPFVQDQAAEIGKAITVLVEPEARDSGPAVAAAAAYVQSIDPDGVVLMLAADHHVSGLDAFGKAVASAASAARGGYIVTFGVRPSAPATGYGYICPGDAIEGDVRTVKAFVEKPDYQTAQRYVAEGYLWNSGNFAFLASTLLGEMQAFEPAMAEAAEAAVSGADRHGEVLRLAPEAFARAPKKSLDYAVMERTQKAAVAPATFIWSDLGAWDAIWDASERDEDGNAMSGDVSLTDAEGVFIRSGGPFVGAFGVNDLLIVAEPDAVLVCRRDDAQAVKTLVDSLKAAGRDIAHKHPISSRAGVTRQTLAKEGESVVELWKLDAGAKAELPDGDHQLLTGRLEGDVAPSGAVLAAEATTLVVIRKR